MKKLIILLLFVIPLQLLAQNWSPEEKAVLEKIKLAWQSWEDAVNQKDLSIWLEKANPSDTWTAWFLPDNGLWTLEDTKRNFELLCKDIARFYWINITPLKIKVIEDHAYTWFYVTSAIEKKDGSMINNEDKRLEIYRKIDGEWRWEAGMSDRYPKGGFMDDN